MILSVNKPEQLFFHQRTDTFDLSVTLTGQQKLSVDLKDFVDWIIYSKEYTAEDIGKEIHKKMEIIDVYTSFAQTKPQCDEENSMKEKEQQRDHIKKYELGTVVENQNEKIPCYKIEGGGKITTYLNILDRGTKKQVIYESNLILNKVRSMTQAEISTERLTNEKNQIYSELSKEIQKERREKEQLRKQVVKLEEELKVADKKLGAKDAEAEEKMEAIFKSEKELLAKNYQLKQELSQIKEKLQAAKKQQQQICQTLDANIISTKQSLNSTRTKMQAAMTEFQRSLEQIKTSKPIRFEKTLMTLQQAYSNQFNLYGCKVQYAGTNAWTHYIFNSPINHNQAGSFKIQIIKTTNRHIMVGVVDYAKQKDQRYSSDSGNAMCYYGHNGRKYPQEAIQGNGFKEGDVVEVDVNRVTCTIKYIINGVHKATQNNSMLADNSEVFMPYVDMYHNDDCVEWLL